MEYVGLLSKAALAPSTQASYRRAWKYFEEFCTELIGQSMELPLTGATISLFVAYLFKKSFAPSTISTYLSAIAYVHNILELPDPTKSFLVDKIVTGTYRLSSTIDSRLPITIPVLNRIVQIIPSLSISSYDQSLYRSMFLFAFSAFARVGELVSTHNVPDENIMQLQDISFLSSSGKIQEVQACFRKFKHNVKGSSKTIVFSHGRTRISAVDSLVEFVQLRGNRQGPLFCCLRGKPIVRSQFDKILHKCLALCGLDGSRYKGHSFRIGAASDAAQQGLSDAKIRTMGRWKSNAFQKYIRSSID